MTFTEEYIPDEDRELEELGNYPTAFGITFTPRVLGITLGVAGLLGALYLAMNWLLPVSDSLRQMQEDKANKERQVEQQRSGVSPAEFQKIENRLNEQQTRKKQILSLFGDPKTLDTLLLDIAQIFRAKNVTLVSFQPQGTGATPIADGSLGAEVNNKLKRQSFTVQLKGRYVDLQEVLRQLERLQPLLLLKNLNFQNVDEGRIYRAANPSGKVALSTVQEGKLYRVDPARSDIEMVLAPKGKELVTSNFTLDTILSLSPEEVARLAPPAPPAAPPPPAGNPAQPAK